jgi:transketolase
MVASMKTAGIDIRDAFFDEVYRLAGSDRNVIFLTADMGALSLNRFKADLRRQYINVGVAEQNLVGIAAGLALAGKKVFIYTIAPFATLRCYEQIKVDICGMRLPVVIIGSGPGITYSSDGPTHHAVQDVAVMRALPEMTILNPADAASASAAARLAYQNAGPVYVRIDKGRPPRLYDADHDFSAGLSRLKPGRDLTIIATGVMVPKAFDVADALASRGIEAGIVDVYRLKPLNEAALLALFAETHRLVTLEEHLLAGGLGSAVAELMADRTIRLPLKRIAIADASCPGYGDREWMHAFYSLDANNITSTIIKWLQETK